MYGFSSHPQPPWEATGVPACNKLNPGLVLPTIADYHLEYYKLFE